MLGPAEIMLIVAVVPTIIIPIYLYFKDFSVYEQRYREID